MHIQMSERIYRDPVHNIISLRTDTSEGELMMRLIDTPEFQRLRRIKQLGLGRGVTILFDGQATMFLRLRKLLLI